MKKILITGGTTFVSQYAAAYFVKRDYEVYVLNRNTKPQVEGVRLIAGDRHCLGNALKQVHFDAAVDITSYNAKDITDLHDALGSFEQYIMISSGAVYLENGVLPFREDFPRAANHFWGQYGTDKIKAENSLLERVFDAYILRPPYLYGPMNNVYREAFIFDCARADRKFYLPKDGEMKLQFFHVKDLCGLMETIMETKPAAHIINVGNPQTVSVREWVTQCYDCFHKVPSFVNVYKEIEQRKYFPFYDYEYVLDVRRQQEIYPHIMPLREGLKEAAAWYLSHECEVKKKPYLDYIDENLSKGEEDNMSRKDGIIPVPEWTAKEIPENEALAFVEKLQLGWNLGNTFDASNCSVSDELEYESAWVGASTTKEMIHTIANAGFRTIRIPVSWHNHVNEKDQISKAWMDRVQEVVDWSLEEGAYVIINIHHDNEKGFMYPAYEHLDRSKKYVQTIWEQIAERFAEYDERLIFETLNEPRHVETDHEWRIDVNSETGKEGIDCINQLNQTAVDTIRANGKGYNPSRYIMAPGYCASPDYALTDGFVVPADSGEADNRILISVHAYTPYHFALAGEDVQDSTDRFSVLEKVQTADIDAFMERLYEKFISKGTGVVIGEFGARAKGDNLEARTEFAAYYVARARYFGMTACWWDNNAFHGDGENFGLLDRRKNQISYPQIVEQMTYYSK